MTKRAQRVLICVACSAMTLVACAAERPGALGQIDIDGDGDLDGFGYDEDGDGDAESIDTDGDGDLDGEDFGDGVLLYEELGTGAEDLTPEFDEWLIVETDPDFDAALDPAHPPPGADGATGEVDPPPSAMLDPSELPARNQGEQGSCVAWAIAGAATVTLHRRDGGVLGDLWASPAFLYGFQAVATRAILPRFVCGGGTYFSTGLDTLVMHGVPPEATVPYRSAMDRMFCEDPDELLARVSESERAAYRVGAYERLVPLTSTAIREAIAGGSAVVFQTPLDDAFRRWTVRQEADVTATFDFTGPPCMGDHCGGHAMAILGYDDGRSAFRVLNSWGRSWGDNGYMWLAASYFDRGLPPNRVAAYALTSRPADLSPVPPVPDEGSFSITAVGAAVLRDASAEGTTQSVLTVRLSMSEPIRIESIMLVDAMDTTFMDEARQALLYGNLAIPCGATGPAEGMATLSIAGTLRNGAAATGSVTVMVPPRAPDPDGAN
jgi:hypothetical protein